MYLLCFNALRVSHRVLTGTCARHVSMCGQSSRSWRDGGSRKRYTRLDVHVRRASRAAEMSSSQTQSLPPPKAVKRFSLYS